MTYNVFSGTLNPTQSINLKQSENIMIRALARNYAVTQVSKDDNPQLIVFTF